jgi:NMD protein affecting ribosome stability and mRNA decay
MRRQRSKTHVASSQPRPDRSGPKASGDPFATKAKLPTPTLCDGCGAVYRRGRWTWGSAPADSARHRCPACRRIAERIPAGVVRIEGKFAKAHRDEIEGRVRNVEQREKPEHALARVMWIEKLPKGGLEVATTDVRLARGIGTALKRAYDGELETIASEATNLLRVSWRRDE